MKPSARVLITGVGGFTGRWLVAHLRSGPRVHLAGLGRSADTRWDLDSYAACDLRNLGQVVATVARVRPEFVFHLAGCNAFAPAEEIESVNVRGFDNLVAAIEAAKLSRPVRMLTIGSAAELGRQGAAKLPVNEAAPCHPESAYGRSKWSVTERALAGGNSAGIEIVVARTFNLAGPGLDRRLALGNFAAQIAAIERGRSGEICCGRLDTRRDYVDVRDAVAAYAAVIERGRSGEVYNVCSGRSHALGDILAAMLKIAGATPTIRADQSPPRPGDLPDVYGSYLKLAAATLWQPTIPLEQSLAEMLEDTRANMTSEKR
jgi:GDP-4-dehydro-6-deoxy-D-mannose reductase